jgi:hypothetical protein
MLLGACGAGGEPVTHPLFESPTTQALLRVAAEGTQGTTVPLRSLTAHVWDTVHFFPEGTPKRAVDARVGQRVVGDEGFLQQPGPLLVFLESGRVVEAVYALPPLSLSSQGESFPAKSATIRLHTKPPAPHGLILE